jgi:hypothetical protein
VSPACEITSQTPDLVAQILHTRYDRFLSRSGIDGLCRITGRKIEILAVHAANPGTGRFRRFIHALKKEYDTICVWQIHNPIVEACLLRYGFAPEFQIEGDGEEVNGLRWDRPRK